MNNILPQPAQLRRAKMPRGESFVHTLDMSVRNQLLWRQRCRETAAQLRISVSAFVDAPPEPLPPRTHKSRYKAPGLNTASVLASLAGGAPRTPQQIADATGIALSSVYPALASLERRGLVRRKLLRHVNRRRYSEWVVRETQP